MTRQHASLTPSLRSKLTPGLNVLLDTGSSMYWFGIGFASLAVYGPIVGAHQDHNVLRYLVAPWVCPYLVGAYYRVAGYNPYGKVGSSGIWARPGFDKVDADAKRLVDTFGSPLARVAVLQCSLRVSKTIFALVAVAAIVTLALRDSLSFAPWTDWMPMGFFGCLIGSYTAVGWLFVEWGLGAWARDSTAGVSKSDDF